MMDSGPVPNTESTLSNKSEKYCISLAFIIRIYHDAWSSECQMLHDHLSGLAEKASHSDMQKIRVTGFFFVNRLHWQSEVEKMSKNSYFRLHFYLRTNKILIHNSFYAFLIAGGKI